MSAETWLDGAQHTFRVWGSRILMVTVAAILIWIGVDRFGPSWTAHIGEGTRGTFTVTRQSCAGGCEWLGIFTPADGGPARQDVRIGSGHHIHTVGDVVPAVDVGASNVFPVDGGYDWLLSVAALVLGSAMLLLWIIRVLRTLLRRDPFPRDTTPSPGTAYSGP